MIVSVGSERPRVFVHNEGQSLSYADAWRLEPKPDPETTEQLLAQMAKMVYLPTQKELADYTKETGDRVYPPSEQTDHWPSEPPPRNIYTVSYVDPTGKFRIEVPVVGINTPVQYIKFLQQKDLQENVVPLRCGDIGRLLFHYNPDKIPEIRWAEDYRRNIGYSGRIYPRSEDPSEFADFKSLFTSSLSPYIISRKLIGEDGKINYPLTWLGDQSPDSRGKRPAIALHYQSGAALVFSSASYTDFYPPAKR